MNLNPVSIAQGHTDSVTALSLSDNTLASGGEDGNIYLWSLLRSPYPILSAPRNEPCSSLKFSLEKPTTLYSAHSNFILSWDIRNMNSPLNEWNVNEDEINSIDLLNGEARLLSADDSGAIQIVNTSTGSVVRTLRKHDNICSSAKFRPNRSWQLISGGLDCRVIVSDWKGSGLGVIIFEMDEIVESIDDDSQFNAAVYSQDFEEESTCSDDEEEVDYETFTETDEDPDEPSAIAGTDITPTDSVSLEASSGLGSETISNQSSTNCDDPINLNNSNSDLTASTNISEPTVVSTAYGNWRSGIPINPPMVHVINCSASGDFVAAGLESSTIELFAGDGKRLSHLESLYGHHRGVSALHFLDDQFLISGGNDRNLFVWTLGSTIVGHHIFHGEKISAFEGRELDHVFVADFSPIIQVLDLSVR